jgi:F-type H+-transporting ATPase subunit a
MAGRSRTLAVGGIALLTLVALAISFRVPLPPIEVRPEEIVIISVGEFHYPVSNSLLTTWIVMLLIVIPTILATRKMELIPTGPQNFFEAIVEAIDSLVRDVAGERGRQFFPIVATIFIFVLVSNWLGLVPGVGPVGIIVPDEKHPIPQGYAVVDLPRPVAELLGSVEHHSEGQEATLIPLLRSPSADLNTTLALAIVSVVMTQVFGMMALGILRYWTRFFNFGNLFNFVLALIGVKPRKHMLGYLFWGGLDAFVGALEFVSELAKFISFSFRLFGNIFAGEVVLIIMAFLFAQILPLPFYLLEVFVGFIQAFVFAILTLVFMTIATAPHGGGHSDESHAHA